MKEPLNGMRPSRVGIWIYAPIKIRSIKLFFASLMPWMSPSSSRIFLMVSQNLSQVIGHLGYFIWQGVVILLKLADYITSPKLNSLFKVESNGNPWVSNPAFFLSKHRIRNWWGCFTELGSFVARIEFLGWVGSLCLKENEHGGLNNKEKSQLTRLCSDTAFMRLRGGGCPIPKHRYNVCRLGPTQANTMKHLERLNLIK